jgi:histidyl-tRNA synthetase
MDTVKPQLLKGFRDFFPEQSYKRQFLTDKIRGVFELYGFLPIETPALEYLETFSGNIGEDEKLFFKFEDLGGRKVALRYDQTVPTCRFVAQYLNQIVMPFKRYQIQTVWRAEKPQKGRYREFIQCDADIFGISEPEADAETIALTLDLYKNFGFKDFIVKINDRDLFKDYPYEVIVIIDKINKIGKEIAIEEIMKKGYSKENAISFIEKLSNIKPSEKLEKIFSYLKSLGFSENNFTFDSSIARSFNYSNGPIWEVVVPGFTSGSVLGGERYDKLVGKFQNQDIPATGFALGFDRTLEAMEQFGLFPELKTKTKVLVTIFSPELLDDSLKIALLLRKNKINTDLFAQKTTRLDKQLKYANKQEIPFVIILGPEEVKKKTVKLKNMKTGIQKEYTIQELLKVIS